jgi:hypothetical protein
MPSYRDKFEAIKKSFNSMEQRVLIDSAILRAMRNEIDELKQSHNVVREPTEPIIDPFVKNQLSVALGEVEELLFGERHAPINLASFSNKDILEETVKRLHDVAQVLRDSSTRAETILDGLDIIPKGKLLKRERKEQMRKASISSLTASLAKSPPGSSRGELQSPPRFLNDSSRGSSPRGRNLHN